jgi:hypothetical protein
VGKERKKSDQYQDVIGVGSNRLENGDFLCYKTCYSSQKKNGDMLVKMKNCAL